MALSQRPAGSGVRDGNEIYTVLVIIATGFVIIGTVCLAYQFHSYYGLDTLFQGAAQLG